MPLDASTHRRPTGLHDVPQSWHIRRRFFGTTWSVTSEPNSLSSPNPTQIPVHSERGSAPGRAPGPWDKRGGIGMSRAFLGGCQATARVPFCQTRPMSTEPTSGRPKSHLGGT